MRNGGAAHKIMKRRGIWIVLRAVVIPSVAEGSFELFKEGYDEAMYKNSCKI